MAKHLKINREPIEASLKACFNFKKFVFDNDGKKLIIKIDSQIRYTINISNSFFCIEDIEKKFVYLANVQFKVFLANFCCMYNVKKGFFEKSGKIFVNPILFLHLAKVYDNILFILLTYYYYNYLPEVFKKKKNMYLIREDVLKKTKIFLDLKKKYNLLNIDDKPVFFGVEKPTNYLIQLGSSDSKVFKTGKSVCIDTCLLDAAR